MKSVEKGALILALWVGLSGIWFASSASAQSAELEEAKRLDAQIEQLYRQGRYAEAVQLIQRALNIRERVLGPVHPEVATSLNIIALLYYNMGKYAEAEPLYKRSLAIREKTLGPEHPHVAQSLNNMAALCATRWHAIFKPAGTNVNFVKIVDPHKLSIRTYERGVEGETLACGTGAVAAALIAASLERVKSPVTVATRGGDRLIVSFRKDGDGFTDLFLEGEAVVVCEGTVYL